MKANRDGRQVSGRMHKCRCIAPSGKGGAVCGNPIVVSYQQLYGKNVYSCGCVRRPKHPPIRHEGEHHGPVTVVCWSYTARAWELACSACGLTFFRNSTKEVEAAGVSCEGHEVTDAEEAKRLRKPAKLGRPPGRPPRSEGTLPRASSLPLIRTGLG